MEFENQLNNSVDVIHCKVSYDGQIRRFALSGTEFTSLKDTVAKLFSINAEFVLKYKDDESDYVTLEHDQDLMTAVMISPKILRILVDTPSNFQQAPEGTTESPCKSGRKRWCHQNQSHPHHKYHHRGQHHGGQHHGGQHHSGQPHHGGNKKGKNEETKRQWIEKKLAWVNSSLQEMSDESQLAPRDQCRKQRLMKKKERLEYFLAHHCDKKPEKRELTQEEEQLNCAIRLQILEINGEMLKLKLRKKEIKSLVKNCQDDQELKAQLVAVKEQKHLLKAQKRDLFDKIQA
jgi:hypothetical protein